MNQGKHPDPKSRLRPIAVAGFFPLLFVLIGVWFYLSQVAPRQRHRKVADRMSLTILSLAEKRPAELTEDQWAFCVMWAWNLHNNYGLVPEYVPTAELERIETHFRVKIDQGVDVRLFDWLWDEYIQAYPGASFYNHWRPSADHNREAFGSGNHSGNPLSEWQQRYKAAKLDAGR